MLKMIPITTSEVTAAAASSSSLPATTYTRTTTTTTTRKLTSSSLLSFVTTSSSITNIITILIFCGFATSVNGLQCHMCGQYNEGVGSITPCLNYSDQYAHLYLKECPKKSDKFCVKYVSELSTVRDCATECVEKEIWETQTYCCNHDGCNGSSQLEASMILLFLPLLFVVIKQVIETYKVRR